MWFGNFLPKHKNLKNIKSDIRNIDKIKLGSVDVIIHLASVANDPMSDLNELKLGSRWLGTLNC